MKTLLESYKKRLISVNELIGETENDGSTAHVRRMERLRTKAGCYRTIIEELEREIKSETHCSCTNDEKHGETSVMCCNECGLPTEEFWRAPNLKK